MVSVLSLENILDIASRSLLYIRILTLNGDGGIVMAVKLDHLQHSNENKEVRKYLRISFL